MTVHFQRVLFALIFVVASLTAMAGTLSVTSPTSGSSLGRNNNMAFLISGASVRVTVRAVVTGPGGATTLQREVNPNNDGEAEGTIALNFSQSSPQGDYTIAVTAIEPNNSYNTVNLNVRVDTLSPKLLNFSPASNSFIRGSVRIAFELLEAQMKEWRVTANNQEIPNNSGTTETNFSFLFDTGLIERDGPQSLALVAKDQADNVLNFAIPTTLDRNEPSTTIAFPRSDTPIRPGAIITVVIDIRDQFASAVERTGVDVILTRNDGTFLARVSRLSFQPQGSNAWRWTGRIRYRAGVFPPSFRLLATAKDKAGNAAVTQTVNLRVGG